MYKTVSFLTSCSMEKSQDFGVLSSLKFGAFLIPLIYFFSSYQSPIPADQVKPLAEYDYEGGNANASRFFLIVISPWHVN